MNLLPLVLTALLASGSVSIEQLSWMAGHWQNSSDGTVTEELWTRPAGGVMLAVNRTVSPSRKTAFEFLRIEQTAKGLAYLAMPGGKPATEFPLKSLDGEKVTFENLQHDFPQRVIYWRGEGGRLCARVEGDAGGGKIEGEEWCWERAR
jgi:hypothetical protein